VWYWKGAAWYQNEVDIPDDWSGKKVQLLLERTKDTYAWINDELCGPPCTTTIVSFPSP